jgi:hypothetical protein
VSPPLQPILLNGCARAATAAEARFRIDRPIAGRAARVIALDDGAADVVRRVAEHPWHDARFLVSEGAGGGGNGADGADADVPLRVIDGAGSSLSAELEDADVAIIVATSDQGAPAASAIARACDRRGIMTAALILGGRGEVSAAVTALRPHAPVLLVTDDEEDVSEVLTALRA